jgi:hypothetical protein
MSELAQAHRSLSLDSAALDFTKYAKAMLAAKGNPSEALQLATARGAGPRLRAMLETPISAGRISDDLLLKAPVAIGSVGDGALSGKFCSLCRQPRPVQCVRPAAG